MMALLAGWAATWILIHRLISGGPLRSWLVDRKTSLVPFLAIAAGRQPFIFSEIGPWRMVATFTLWFATLWLHPHFGSGLRLLPPIA
jgi:hypothetical protein